MRSGVSGRTSAGSHILNLIARLPRMTFPRHARARGAPGHRATGARGPEADTFGSQSTDTFDSRIRSIVENVRPFGSGPAKTEAARRTFVPFDPSIAPRRPYTNYYTCGVSVTAAPRIAPSGPVE